MGPLRRISVEYQRVRAALISLDFLALPLLMVFCREAEAKGLEEFQ